MIIKQCQFKGIDTQGRINVLPLHVNGLEKTAFALDAMRSKLHPTVQDFIAAVRQTPAGIYVLVNAMGAGEYWGSNVNGDLFPEKALIHSPPEWDQLPVDQKISVGQQWDYGFPTFMGAFPYKHHVNKDPSRAFGRVELAVWNPEMHRVELVVYLDRALCKQFDAYDIIERIERGEFPDVSMGCKVPYDVCTICEHKSKTRADYCEHALTMMNKILPDGRKVAVRNDFPKFFDISFVFIGADKTAKVMAKLAQKGNQICMGDYCVNPRSSAEVGEVFSKKASLASAMRDLIYKKSKSKNSFDTSDRTDEAQSVPERNENAHIESMKIASSEDSCSCNGVCDPCGGSVEKLAEAMFGVSKAKSASHRKLSEIVKDIPAGPFTRETLPRLESTERDIPNDVLDGMSNLPLGQSMSTSGMLGMVLKPREFQRILLIQMGDRELANDLDKKNMTFGHSNQIDESIPVGEEHVNPDLKELMILMGLVRSRSAATPALDKRVSNPGNASSSPQTVSNDPVMQKIAAAYNGYRRSLLKKAAEISNFLTTDSQLLADLYGSSMVEAFACGVSKVASASVLGPDSLAYLVGAYADRDFHVSSKEVVASLAQLGVVVEAA
jgi:hypothetical protein